MKLTITKHSDGYKAVITSPSGEIYWRSQGPANEHSLRIALNDIGYNSIDVSDAFAAADPAIRNAQWEAVSRVIRKEYGNAEGERLLNKVIGDLNEEAEEARKHERSDEH